MVACHCCDVIGGDLLRTIVTRSQLHSNVFRMCCNASSGLSFSKLCLHSLSRLGSICVLDVRNHGKRDEEASMLLTM